MIYLINHNKVPISNLLYIEFYIYGYVIIPSHMVSHNKSYSLNAKPDI